MPVMLFLSVALSMSATDVGTFRGGSGTKDDPFRITKQADLVEIQSYLHYGTTTYEGYFFRMENDLRFNSYSGLATGLSNHRFQATFDGNGKRIVGIQAVMNSNASGFGVFGWTGEHCTIKNLTVDSCSITANGNCNYSAFLVSRNSGLVENCHVTNCTINFQKCGTSNQNGGLVAYNENLGRVRNCTFRGNVFTGCKFGAIAGYNNGGQCDSCISYADIAIVKSNVYVGGISGFASYTSTGANVNFLNCINCGYIHSISASITGTYVGGICGDNNKVNISGCSNEGTIMALNYVGGIIGYMWNQSAISDCRNAGTVADIFMSHDSIPASFGMGDYQGGIAGYVKEGTISRCFNVGTIRSLRAAGGLVGNGESIVFADCYNAGLVDAPHSWLSGNTITQQCGGLVGYKSGASSFNITFERCLSLGTVNSAEVARPQNAVYLGRPSTAIESVYTNCFYDSWVAGWDTTSTGALTTEVLTSGQPLEGFSTDVWTFAAGYYPRLKAQATTDAALAGAAPLFLPAGNIHSRVLNSFTTGTADTAATWSLKGEGAVLSGNNVTVTRTDMPTNFTLTATAGSASRACLLTVFPQLFTGSGTETDPYIIYTYAELKQLARATSEGNLTFKGEYLKLGADIDMESDATFSCMSTSMSAPFLGNFSGNGHKLKNWKLTAHTNSTQYAGLFGYVGESGVVSDLVIDGTCSIGLYLNGGTIAGRLFGNVSNCRVLPSALLSKAAGGTWGGIAGRIDNSGSVIDCYVGSDITLTGASNRVGGITSSNNGTIIGCQYAGSLNGTAANHIGGIAAENGGSISDCIVSGVVNAQYYVGGITSNNLSTGSISNCLITAPIMYTQQVDFAGAITGINSGKVNNVVYDSQISLLDNIGVPGKLTREIIAAPAMGERWQADNVTYPKLKKFASEDMAMLTSFPVTFPDADTRITMREGAPAICYTATGLTIKLDDADDFSVRSGKLSFTGYTSYCYDYLIRTYAGRRQQMRVAAYGDFLTGSGTEADPYIIATEANLRKLVTESSRAANQGDYAGMHFKVTADITLNSAITGISCGNAKMFNGIIHGEGHSIANLNINGTAACTGLVGYLGPKGVIENLHITSGTVKSNSTQTGAIAGYCRGIVRNCSNGADVTGSATYTGGVTGYAYNSPELINLTNTGNVTSTQFYTGGVAGAVAGQGTYAKFLNRGDVAGTMYVGGVAGHMRAATVSDLTNYGHVGNATTAVCNMHGGVIGTAGVIDTLRQARNYGIVSGGSTAIGGVMGRYWPETDTKHVINIEECLNADSVVGKLQNVGGIVGQGDKYSLRVERCVNIGSVSNVNAKLAAGTPGAGGIVGGGIPVINNCFNAGVISGINCLGGILGRVPDNASTATITNCTNTGWLTGYTPTAANIGSISGYWNTGSTYTNCRYDTCMSNVPAVMKADREGAAGVRTTDIAPSGLYPVPAFATDSLVQLYTVPVIYKVPCTRYNVSRSFYVRSIPGLTWDIPSVLTLTDSLVNVRDVLLQGDYSLTANYGTFSRVIPMVMNFDHTNGVDNLYDSDNELQIMPGQIVVPAGQYAVFNLAGQTIATGRTAHPTAIQLPAGIYLIRYGRHAKKVLVP